jgi:hypothetical protein
MLAKLINLPQENLPMAINLKSMKKIKKNMPLFLMLRLNTEIIMRKNHPK